MSPSTETSERPASATSEAPTLIRQFPKEPRWLDLDNERTGGSEAADWRHTFVKVIAEHTQDMTTVERTEFFEACVTRNKDRYIQTFAAYYGMYPEHIPDRPGGVKSTEQEQKGMVWSAEIFEKQRTLFKVRRMCLSETSALHAHEGSEQARTGTDSLQETWVGYDQNSAFRAKTTAIEETVPGPKDESDPCIEPPKCDHCRKDAQKQKWLYPLSSVRRALAKKPKTNPRAMSPPTLQYDGTPSTASSPSIKDGDRSNRSSLKELPARPTLSAPWPPTEHAQHVEQQA